MLRKISLILLLSCQTAFAGVVLSGSAINTRFNDKDFILQNNAAIAASYGYFLAKDNYTVTIQTNRFLESNNKQFVISRANGKTYELKSKLRTDSLLIGYKFKQFNPSVIITNSRLRRKISHAKVNNSLLYGLNINYFMSKNHSISASYILLNKEFGLSSAVLLSINLFF